MAEASNDPELAKYMRNTFPSPYTLADAHSWIEHCHSQPILAFGIFTLDGEYAGSLGLQPPKGDSIYAGTRELGYLVIRKFWGRGSKSCPFLLRIKSDFVFLPYIMLMAVMVFVTPMRA